MSKQKVLVSGENRVYDPFVKVSEGERAVKYYRLESDIRDLTGKILTIVDASVSDEKQNKAIKDLVKENIRQFLNWYQEICFKGSQGSSVCLPE